MSVNLEFGYKGYVAVQDTKGRDLYRREIKSDKEIKPWIEANEPSVQGWGILESSFVPVRVDNCADFARDLFLPTFVNHVLKINNVCLKIIAALFAIPWDLITFPIRFIAWPIRYSLYNSKPLPVEELIQASPHFAEAKREGVVNLVARTSYTKATQTLEEALGKPELNKVPYQASKTNLEVTRLVNLKALPWTETGRSSRDWTESYWMDLDKQKWLICGSTGTKTSGSTYSC